MYDNEKNYPVESGIATQQARRLDITMRQNIDAQIKQAEDRVAELKATKERLEASNMLDVRIDDIQRAMRF